jgi:hypothetical protein
MAESDRDSGLHGRPQTFPKYISFQNFVSQNPVPGDLPGTNCPIGRPVLHFPKFPLQE